MQELWGNYYVQLHYLEADDTPPDTVRFHLPYRSIDEHDDVGAQLANAIDDAMECIDIEEFDDRFEWIEAVLDAAAERMHGSWMYMKTTKVIEI